MNINLGSSITTYLSILNWLDKSRNYCLSRSISPLVVITIILIIRLILTIFGINSSWWTPLNLVKFTTNFLLNLCGYSFFNSNFSSLNLFWLPGPFSTFWDQTRCYNLSTWIRSLNLLNLYSWCNLYTWNGCINCWS